MKKESNIQKTIQLAVSERTNATMWRNNVGTGWVGQTSRTKDGGVYIKNARPLKAGLCVGSSDLIGFTQVEITPEMVGKKIAVFTAIEVKTANGRRRKEQINFCEFVKSKGGKAGFARSADDAVGICG